MDNSLFSFENIDWLLVGIYFAAQFINVVLSTIKSIVTIKGSRIQSIAANTVSYTLSAVITIFVAKASNVFITVGVTAITNILGVWMSLIILDKLRKDRLWLIQATVAAEDFDELIADLHADGIDFIQIETNWDRRRPLNVYSYTKEQSNQIKAIFRRYDVKFVITQNSGELK